MPERPEAWYGGAMRRVCSVVALCWLGVGVAGCFQQPVSCDPGTDGCPCNDGGCLDGLICVANLCETATSAGTQTSSSTAAASTGTDATSLAIELTSTSSSTRGESETSRGTDITGSPADATSALESETSTSVASTGATSGDTVEGTTAAESTTAWSDDATTDPTMASTGEETLPAAVCGNGQLEPGEECELGAGCTDCQLDSFDCNPVNNAGCPPSTDCIYTGNGVFACIRDQGAVGEGEACGVPVESTECATGSGCFGEYCPAGYGYCCHAWCDHVGDWAPCETGRCLRFWVEPSYWLGLEWLGFCAETD